MSKTYEETALATREEENFEQAQSSLTTAARAEVEAALILAKKFPRNEDKAFQKLMHSCERTTFAENATYSFPRGSGMVSGPSVNIAREAARVWENIEYGLLIVFENEVERKIRAWAWDKETNTRSFAEDTFAKLIYRKKGGWIKPDERDLRELTNRRGSILIRNCILSIMPKDLIDDALIKCKDTLKKAAKQDPDKARKNLILAFSQINVTVQMIEEKLGHPISKCTEDEIVELRQIWQSINDGNSRWSEYVEEKNGAKEPEKGTINMNSFKPKVEDSGESPKESDTHEKKESPANGGHAEETIDDKLRFALKNMTHTYKKAAKSFDLPETVDPESLDDKQKADLHAKINSLLDKNL